MDRMLDPRRVGTEGLGDADREHDGRRPVLAVGCLEDEFLRPVGRGLAARARQRQPNRIVMPVRSANASRFACISGRDGKYDFHVHESGMIAWCRGSSARRLVVSLVGRVGPGDRGELAGPDQRPGKTPAPEHPAGRVVRRQDGMRDLEPRQAVRDLQGSGPAPDDDDRV